MAHDELQTTTSFKQAFKGRPLKKPAKTAESVHARPNKIVRRVLCPIFDQNPVTRNIHTAYENISINDITPSPGTGQYNSPDSPSAKASINETKLSF